MNRHLIAGLARPLIAGLLTLLPAMHATAADKDSPWSLQGRVGYNIGAAAPMGIPATIRELNSFQLTPNIHLGLDLHRLLATRWGLTTGLRFENKGMDVAITTKGYHMAMVKGGEQLEGVYTGRVEQKTKAWMLTMPLMATCDLLPHRGPDPRPQWRLQAGLYLSVLTSKAFSGNVADGYLRKDDPTGQKIEMGHAMDERATYDFSGDMRRLQTGLTFGADWQADRHIGLSAGLSWGLSGLMHSTFKTVEQTLYPIYGTLAVTYRIR